MIDIEYAISSAQKENPVAVNIKEIKSLEKKHTKPTSVFQSGSMISSNQFLFSYHLTVYYQNVSMGVCKIQMSHYSVIWVKWPQNVFVEKQTLEIGVYSAVIEFNEGCQVIHKVLKYIGLDTGSQLTTKSMQWDSVHINKMVKKCSEKGKKRRKTLRGVEKGYLDKEKELEPKESYIAGGH